jgi:hypothetical protein
MVKKKEKRPTQKEVLTVRVNPDIKRKIERMAEQNKWTASHAAAIILTNHFGSFS